MTASNLYKKLHDLCSLGIVRKEYIDVRILLAILQIPEDIIREQLRILEDLGLVRVDEDSIELDPTAG